MSDRVVIKGRVAHGRKLGVELGFPTANILVESLSGVENGVYVVRISVGGVERGGVANLGVRPTVSDNSTQRVLEVHIFDFDEDIYGEEVEVEFLQFIRAEKKFESIDALKSQMEEDRREAKEFFR